MPSEISTAVADPDLGRRVEELSRELAEARDQQTATSEILRVIVQRCPLATGVLGYGNPD